MATETAIERKKISFRATKKVGDELEQLAIKQGIKTSELIRKYIDQGMNVDKTKSDIDFIRKNIREEIEIANEKLADRIMPILYLTAVHAIPQCLFSAEILYKLVRFKEGDKNGVDEMWNKSKRETGKLLRKNPDNMDVIVQGLFKEFYSNFNTNKT